MSFLNETIQRSLGRAQISERVERGALLALAFILPLFEAPKNVLWIALLAIWLANRWRARDFGGPWDRWDTLIALWIASGYASAAFAGIHDSEWRAAGDIVRYASVLWILKRSRYPDRTWAALLAAIVAGAAVGLVWGYYGVLIADLHRALKLHSVGHVNHSAIYLAIVSGVALTATQAWWRTADPVRKALGFVLLAFFVVSLVWMESRAAVGAAFIAALLLLSVRAVRQRRHLGTVALFAAVAVGATLLLKPQVLEKNTKFLQQGDLLNGRDLVWRVGLAAWREFPLFGVGMDNFGRINYKDLESWSAKRGETFDRQTVLLAPHGHSVYVNSLAERGLLGFGLLLAILAAWAVTLVHRVPDAHSPPLRWAYWGGAGAAWIITVVVGALNTTLHHEQALLSMLLLGGWLSVSRSTEHAPRAEAA
jgi:O-antigen ligase